MSTITVILEPDQDGTLHLPVPAELLQQRIRVTAELEPLGAPVVPQPGCLKGFWMAPDFDAPLEELKEYME
jgi:hypothetical protein